MVVGAVGVRHEREAPAERARRRGSSARSAPAPGRARRWWSAPGRRPARRPSAAPRDRRRRVGGADRQALEPARRRVERPRGEAPAGVPSGANTCQLPPPPCGPPPPRGRCRRRGRLRRSRPEPAGGRSRPGRGGARARGRRTPAARSRRSTVSGVAAGVGAVVGVGTGVGFGSWRRVRGWRSEPAPDLHRRRRRPRRTRGRGLRTGRISSRRSAHACSPARPAGARGDGRCARGPHRLDRSHGARDPDRTRWAVPRCCGTRRSRWASPAPGEARVRHRRGRGELRRRLSPDRPLPAPAAGGPGVEARRPRRGGGARRDRASAGRPGRLRRAPGRYAEARVLPPTGW